MDMYIKWNQFRSSISAAPADCSLASFLISFGFLLFSLDFEELNISLATLELHRFDVATDFIELFENGQDNEVDESTLTAGDFGGVSIA